MSLSKWLPCDFEQCHPLLWGGGILVDHWSTISSLERFSQIKEISRGYPILQELLQLSGLDFNMKTISVAVRYKKSISIIETVISIDYRYIDFLASYFSDRSRGIDRVGDNWRTVNTSANPHISDQLTELENSKTRAKHCYVELSSWYELGFAIICFDTNVTSALSTAIQQLRDGFDSK